MIGSMIINKFVENYKKNQWRDILVQIFTLLTVPKRHPLIILSSAFDQSLWQCWLLVLTFSSCLSPWPRSAWQAAMTGMH